MEDNNICVQLPGTTCFPIPPFLIPTEQQQQKSFSCRGTLYGPRIFALKVSVKFQLGDIGNVLNSWVVAMEKMFFHSHLDLHRNQFGREVALNIAQRKDIKPGINKPAFEIELLGQLLAL